MIAFLDTEFTDFVEDPCLLSVGIVTADGREFYAEVTDRHRLAAANHFVREAVLSQFGQVPRAPCRYAELGQRAAAYFLALGETMESSEVIEVAFDYPTDWSLLECAIKNAGTKHWDSVERLLRPVNIAGVTGILEGDLAAEEYFESVRLELIHRHHALVDARALQVAYTAAKASIVSGEFRW